MIELYELRQFLAFAKAGTLSEASETLHLSQPALSRNMKKLEEDLGISLFLRQKNKLELNENGMYVLELTKKLLEDADLLVAKARDYDRRNRTITLGLCAPAPAWLLTPLISNLYPHMTLQTELKDEERLLKDLENHVYHLAVVHRQPKDGLYYVKECGREKLSFSLPKGHKYARRKSLSFQEMNGENMLLMSDIGFWDLLHREKMPDSRFLTQYDRFSFNELVESSTLPSFITDLSEKYIETASGRVTVPISDEEASVTYYLVCRNDKKKEFSALFAAL